MWDGGGQASVVNIGGGSECGGVGDGGEQGESNGGRERWGR